MATPHDEKEREYLRRVEAEAAPLPFAADDEEIWGRSEEESKERIGGRERRKKAPFSQKSN
jgi:hypothetical protein